MKKLVFYIKNYAYITSEDEFDLTDISPILRRKLSLLDKAAYSTLNKMKNLSAQEIIFSSRQGEMPRLQSIITQYKDSNEVSPNHFSSSVHNYFVGFFTLLKKLNLPYNAISSGENSISAGIVEALMSKSLNILFCYAESLGGAESISCYISKEECPNSVKCEFTKSINSENNNEFLYFIDFLNNKTKVFKTALGTIERLN